MAFSDAAQCTSNTKSTGERCRNPAVRGYPVCRLHGAGSLEKPGGRPATHGRYSRLKRESLRDLIAEYEADPNPLDVLPELAAARALFDGFVSRYDELVAALIAWNEEEYKEAAEEKRKPRPQPIPSLESVTALVSEVTKIVQRIESVKAQNAISRKDFSRVLQEMTRVVDLEVRDEAVKKRIRDGWLSIRLA